MRNAFKEVIECLEKANQSLRKVADTFRSTAEMQKDNLAKLNDINAKLKAMNEKSIKVSAVELPKDNFCSDRALN
jgi:hypothetical protein